MSRLPPHGCRGESEATAAPAGESAKTGSVFSRPEEKEKEAVGRQRESGRTGDGGTLGHGGAGTRNKNDRSAASPSWCRRAEVAGVIEQHQHGLQFPASPCPRVRALSHSHAPALPLPHSPVSSLSSSTRVIESRGKATNCIPCISNCSAISGSGLLMTTTIRAPGVTRPAAACRVSRSSSSA